MMKPLTHKVWATVERAGKNLGHHKIDLIFKDGTPYAVFEWTVLEGCEVPACVAELSPRFLSKFPGDGFDHLYETPVVDPRPAH